MKVITVLMMWLVLVPAVMAQTALPSTGPVIEGFGPVFEVADDALTLDEGVAYKVSMDVSASDQSVSSRNRHLESAARFLNMHPENKITFALVVHGSATQDLLTDSAFKERFQAPNPSTALLNALARAGVSIILCGQSAAYKGHVPEDFHPGVSMAMSAMTAHVLLQRQGYALIPF